MTPDTSIPPVSQSLVNLCAGIDRLEGKLITLRERLAPVLTAANPKDQEPVPGPPPAGDFVPARIDLLADRVSVLANLAEDLLVRQVVG